MNSKCESSEKDQNLRVVTPQEEHLDSLEILGAVAQQSHVSSPKDAGVSQPKPTIHFSRRSSRQYLAKKAAESSKMSSGNDILMEHVDDTLQEKQPSSAIVADKTTDGVHTSVDTFFVAGKEYLNSPVHAPSVPGHVSTEDIAVTLNASGSADNLTTLDDQDMSADPMEEVVIPDDDSAEVNEECADVLISEKERLEQERLWKEWEDYKKSSDLAKEE